MSTAMLIVARLQNPCTSQKRGSFPASADGIFNPNPRKENNMVTTLEIPEDEVQDFVDAVEEITNETEAVDDDTVDIDPDIQPAELTQEEKIEAYIRKEQVLREAQSDLNSLEDQQADARREMNSYKKPISEARAKVERLISCDVSGFLRWEKEQELPLLQKAEEMANAWRNNPVGDLDVTPALREKLCECFITCGQVADWLGKDFPDKKTGLNGEKTKERLRDAINKIAGNMENSND